MKLRYRIAARTLAGTALLLGALLPGSAQAFIVDGFWSGMSPRQLVATAAAHGLVARPGAAGQWFIGTTISSPLQPRLLGEFSFCGNYLVSYTRNIHSDADYANTLAAIFATYGPPRKMNFSWRHGHRFGGRRLSRQWRNRMATGWRPRPHGIGFRLAPLPGRVAARAARQREVRNTQSL